MDYEKEIKELLEREEKLKIYYYNEKSRRDQLIERREALNKMLQRSLDSIDVLEQVKILLQNVSEYAREQSRLQIEQLVTNCLQYIFDTGIEFKIEINEVRGRPEAEFYVVSNIDGEIIKTKPQDARGGGIVDIISLAIRIAMLQCTDLKINGPLMLDEPAKHVSDDYINQVGEFLKQVSIMFERQVIMVTHNRHLSEIADNWYKILMVNGASVALNES